MHRSNKPDKIPGHPQNVEPPEAMIRVGRISYLNVDPIYYGLENGLKPSWMQITAAPPAALNRQMAEGQLDISPVSTGAYARHAHQWLILPDLSISCHGPVMSVLLASRFPVEALDGKRVLVTSESGTAVLLLKLIFAIKGVRPQTESGPVETGQKIDQGYDAVMIIGDKALSGKWGRHYEYRLDLGDAWYRLSGLPIVFAVWAVRKTYARYHADRVGQMIGLFKDSARAGTDQMARIIAAGAQRLHLDEKILNAYFDAMEYDLDEKKQAALAAFFNGLHEHGIIEQTVPLDFFAHP